MVVVVVVVVDVAACAASVRFFDTVERFTVRAIVLGVAALVAAVLFVALAVAEERTTWVLPVATTATRAAVSAVAPAAVSLVRARTRRRPAARALRWRVRS